MKRYAGQALFHPARLAALAAALLFLLSPVGAYAGSADLTRHLGQYQRLAGAPNVTADEFRASAGPARLIVTGIPGTDAVTSATVILNDKQVLGPQDFKKSGASLTVPVQLSDENRLVVTLNGRPGSSLAVRVKQEVDVALNITSRIHFNTQVSNFEASKRFYQDLGFVGAFPFPRTNTLEVARAIGVETPTRYDGSLGPAAGGYLLQVELIFLANFGGSFIDLIEFTIPRNDDPPYPHLYHLGMARAALHSTDVTADYNYLRSLGVRFLSAPATRSNGQKFAIFKDPDGTFYELTEVTGTPIPGSMTRIVSVGRVNVNVSDFERSQAFYQMLGFQSSEPLAATDSLDVARAMGLDRPYRLHGELMQYPGDGSAIELVQWLEPYDPAPPYPLPVNHIGIHRVAYSTSNLEADVAALKAVGIEFLTEIAPCCAGPQSSTGIISFLDPDGTVFELVGPITPAGP